MTHYEIIIQGTHRFGVVKMVLDPTTYDVVYPALTPWDSPWGYQNLGTYDTPINAVNALLDYIKENSV